MLKLRRVLTLLDEARNPGDLATQPGYRLHRLKGDMAGWWSTCVSGNWRVDFRFENKDGPWMWTSWTTFEPGGTAIMAMLNPCHPGEILRDNLEAAKLSVTEAAVRLRCTRQALSRLLNGKAGTSPGMALVLERIGLERRGLLDAAAGELRACTGASGSGCRRTARAARMIGSCAAEQGAVPPAADRPFPNGRLFSALRSARGIS